MFRKSFDSPCVSRRVALGVFQSAVLVLAIVTEFSAPVTTYIDTPEVQAGLESRFPWSTTAALTVEVSGGSVTVQWRLGQTIMNWVMLCGLLVNLTVVGAVYIKWHTTAGVVACIVVSVTNAGLGCGVKVSLYYFLVYAWSELGASNAFETGDYI